MVYDWGDKEQVCYQLYVEERKSLDEVMQHMRDAFGFCPSKRAFQTQFRRWDFPSKHSPAHRNAPLVERIRQLWENNTSQKDMLRTLNEEGYDIRERELMRVRGKNRWLLRVPNGTKSFGSTTQAAGNGDNKVSKTKKRKAPVDVEEEQDENDGGEEEASGNAALRTLEKVMMEDEADPSDTEDLQLDEMTAEEQLSPEIQEKRKHRMEKLQKQSAELWATKKRRRRTRGWAGLPADPPGPPRFPSETTIDESKAFLHMNNEEYREMRDQFQTICEEAGFIKKTIAGPEKWQAAKDRLIAENPKLNHEFYGPLNGVPQESKSLALDVVCTDVTKRMRTLERRLTIAEAKNILHINPEQSRDIRNEFYEILKSDHFTSKLEAGDDHWKELKQEWIAQSELLTEILAPGNDDPEHGEKLKAVEVLSRDVMKRLRDDQTKRDPARKKQINLGPGPGPAPPRVTLEGSQSITPASHAPTASMLQPHTRPAKKQATTPNRNDNIQIDPSLLAAAADPSLAVDQLQQYAASAESHGFPIAGPYTASPAIAASATSASPGPPFSSLAVLFRLSPLSHSQGGMKLWLGTLTTLTVAELRHRALQSRGRGVDVAKIEGIISADPAAGTTTETLFPIDRDDELQAFVEYVAGGKLQFNVQFVNIAGGAD